MAFIKYKAKILDAEKYAIGGLCDFEDKNGNTVYLMLHKNKYGEPTISKIDINTLKASDTSRKDPESA